MHRGPNGDPEPLGVRPSFPATNDNPFATAGVANPAAAQAALQEFLTPDGNLPVTPPMWETTPQMRAAHWGLRRGRVREYEQVMTDVAVLYAPHAIDDVALTLDRDHPGAGAVARAHLADRISPVSGAEFDLTPAAGGKHMMRPHPFSTPVDPETHLPIEADPVTMRDLHRILSKDNRVVETVDELAAVVHLEGEAAPHTWQYSPDLPARILQAQLSEDATYQALAFTYSGGRSTDTGMGARWEAADNTRIDPAAKQWLFDHGYGQDPWDEFATWAVADSRSHVEKEPRPSES